ncbi:TetR/AcrR family transcriptional regulator [Aeoliella sp. ICT_H6.2]|uniref:TetR/AcrR family transcriptional regulator n=1 Tax=Aeoliella straminimaris TaxID=2954799 RepID=A0A9X2FDD6_9BACT|nr:TetR/AcrR family transcriptional regulator [Aeoliella straminimaris]MCO6046890.1 TetR/AcrR family transcriptional regulator [Aeoliella straminimaris]
MGRPSTLEERRKTLLPVLTEVFSELGYRRTTIAELAERCGVQENILYRMWSDKKAMFLAAIDFLFWRRMAKWQQALESDSSGDRVARLIDLTANDLGEQGLYRIIFSALGETDDADFKEALKQLYLRYHQRIRAEVAAYRAERTSNNSPGEADTAWALIAMVAFLNIAIELDLLSPTGRKRLFQTISKFLLDDGSD